MISRDDPGFERRLHDNTRGAVAQAGQVTHDAATMIGEINATAARLRRVLDAANAALKASNSAN